MSTKSQIQSTILAMLKNPQAWTSYKGGNYGELRNSRIRCFLRTRTIRKGWWTRSYKEIVGAYIYGPSEGGYCYANEVAEVEIDSEEAVKLWRDRRDEKIMAAVDDRSWPSGVGCPYCGTILTGGNCTSCGAAKTLTPASVSR